MWTPVPLNREPETSVQHSGAVRCSRGVSTGFVFHPQLPTWWTEEAGTMVVAMAERLSVVLGGSTSEKQRAMADQSDHPGVEWL